jgi:hypothetical protein
LSRTDPQDDVVVVVGAPGTESFKPKIVVVGARHS